MEPVPQCPSATPVGSGRIPQPVDEMESGSLCNINPGEENIPTIGPINNYSIIIYFCKV